MLTLDPPKAQAPRHRYLPADFQVKDWDQLRPYYDELAERSVDSPAALRQWLLDWNELDAVVGEDFAWRYVRMSQHSADADIAEAYQFAVTQIAPQVAPYEDRLNRKLVESPHRDAIELPGYDLLLRNTENAVALYREANIALSTEAQLKAKEYSQLFGAMTVEVDGEMLTLQQAGTFLEEPDRAKRERVYRLINERLRADTEALEAIFDELVRLRHQMALNAGFDNYRDYKFRALDRFDYSVQDCLDFHASIAKAMVPLEGQLLRYRKEALGLDTLRPWDLAVDPSGEAPLRPFEGGEQLLEKSIDTLAAVHPYFGECLRTMREMEHLDLVSRPNKSPGGYNMPLVWTGVPFVFMNATKSFGDLRTLMHESGHAVHSFLSRHFELVAAKRVPSEVAELASMTMELLTMDHWANFFPNEADWKRARIKQLSGVLKTLPWIATIDAFQHWIYTHPEHTREERKTNWLRLKNQYQAEGVDRTGLEHYADYQWHRQLHLFQVPFYYIEYGFAQLGAIAIWQRYRQDPEAALRDYVRALQLGYTRPIPELYAAAGIAFDFSPAYVQSLGDFVQAELEELL